MSIDAMGGNVRVPMMGRMVWVGERNNIQAGLPRCVATRLLEIGNTAVQRITAEWADEIQALIRAEEQRSLVRHGRGQGLGRPDIPLCRPRDRQAEFLLRAVQEAATTLLREIGEGRSTLARSLSSQEAKLGVQASLGRILNDPAHALATANTLGICYQNRFRAWDGWGRARAYHMDDPQWR